MPPSNTVRTQRRAVMEAGVVRCVSKACNALDLDEAIVEGGRTAKVCQRLARHLIRVAAVGGEFFPPDRKSDYETFPRLVGDPGAGLHRTAVVENAHEVAIDNLAPARVD